MIGDVLMGLPAEWWWSVDKLPKGNRSIRRKGKKKIELPFAVYVCNGELIGTSGFASATVEGVNPEECLIAAVEQLRAKIATLNAGGVR